MTKSYIGKEIEKKKEYSESEKKEIRRRRQGYPAVCLKCGARTKKVDYKIMRGKLAGKFDTRYECPTCGTTWGGFI